MLDLKLYLISYWTSNNVLIPYPTIKGKVAQIICYLNLIFNTTETLKLGKYSMVITCNTSMYERAQSYNLHKIVTNLHKYTRLGYVINVHIYHKDWTKTYYFLTDFNPPYLFSYSAKRRRKLADFPGASHVLTHLKEKPTRRRVGLISTGAPARRKHIFLLNEVSSTFSSIKEVHQKLLPWIETVTFLNFKLIIVCDDNIYFLTKFQL